MELTTDIMLRGTAWNTAISALSTVFPVRPHYDLYILSLAIGVMYDKRIEKPEENGEEPKSVPRNVIRNNDNGNLDFIFQAAILSTSTEELTEDQRLDIAFGDSTDFNKLTFLTQFANFGITKLVEQIGDSDEESMENIKTFLSSTVEGCNFEIDDLPDEVFDFAPLNS